MIWVLVGVFLLVLGIAEYLMQRAEARQRHRRQKIEVGKIITTRMDMGGGRIRR